MEDSVSFTHVVDIMGAFVDNSTPEGFKYQIIHTRYFESEDTAREFMSYNPNYQFQMDTIRG